MHRSPAGAVAYLKDQHGVQTSVSTLAKWRHFGTGPTYTKFANGRITYRTEALDEWRTQNSIELSGAADARAKGVDLIKPSSITSIKRQNCNF